MKMQVERGNTQKGVNAEVLGFLMELQAKGDKITDLYDIPCGQGEFIRVVQTQIRNCQVVGQDLFAEPLPEIKANFYRGDIEGVFQNNQTQLYDVVTCISGVMCFDGIATFFKKVNQHVRPGGWFIVTNDNVLTVRDRLSFFFGGRLKRFQLLYSPQEGNWNVVLIQALWKHLVLNDFKIVKVKYISWYPEDFLFIPFALIIYPIWWLSFYFKKSPMSQNDRMKLFPISALLARHYVIYAQKQQ